jgi:1,2-diacylglycerol-3-alpha-glucose alpha-1,2-galactosyltransferase
LTFGFSQIIFAQKQGRIMKVHMVCETPFGMKGNGVYTAYVDSLELLRAKNDVEVVVNNEGHGDVFHSHTYGPYYFWKGRKYRGKRIFTAHVIPDSARGSFPLWKAIMPLSRWYLKKVYEYADVCIAISPMVASSIRELGVRTRIVSLANPILLEHWAFTPEKRKMGREMLGLKEDDFVVLGVGQLVERKGVEDFLDVAVAIPEARFVWAGGRPFGPFSDGLIRINTRIAHAPDHVTFTGMLGLDKMPFVYAAADAMIFTSYQENCPLAPLEAAACGLPVVFRDLPEYALLYNHPYLKAGSTSAFIEMTRQLIHDPTFLQAGKELSHQLITQFDKDHIREELMGLYRSMMVN